MNGVLLAMFQFWRNRAVTHETQMFVVLNTFAFFVTLAFVLEDPLLQGIEMLMKSPSAISIMAFVGLTLCLKMYLKLVL